MLFFLSFSLSPTHSLSLSSTHFLSLSHPIGEWNNASQTVNVMSGIKFCIPSPLTPHPSPLVAICAPLVANIREHAHRAYTKEGSIRTIISGTVRPPPSPFSSLMRQQRRRFSYTNHESWQFYFTYLPHKTQQL